MSIDDPDGARGGRVEIIVRACENGDAATALGILAGMSLEERMAFGPAIAEIAAARGHKALAAAAGLMG